MKEKKFSQGFIAGIKDAIIGSKAIPEEGPEIVVPRAVAEREAKADLEFRRKVKKRMDKIKAKYAGVMIIVCAVCKKEPVKDRISLRKRNDLYYCNECYKNLD